MQGPLSQINIDLISVSSQEFPSLIDWYVSEPGNSGEPTFGNTEMPII